MFPDRDNYNLIDQPWILARHRDGAVRELSILDTFGQASELAEIVGDLPTQAFAITRLLVAVLHRAMDGPRDEEEWAELWQAGELPMEQISRYLHTVRDRFDLLHPALPFYQVSDLHTSKNESFGLERLIADAPTGRPYLTMRLSASFHAIEYSEAARWLVHCQAFDPSGIKSGAVGDGRVKNGKGYPIGVGWAGAIGGILAVGRTLRETLLLNLIATNFDSDLDCDSDRPPWERPQLTAQEEGRDPRGPVDLLTWQSRRIRLFGSSGVITGVLICNGDRLEPQNRHRWEPMTAWRRSANQEKKLGLPLVYMPRQHDPDRALWRGLAALLPSQAGSAADGSSTLAPRVLRWLAHLQLNELISPGFRLRVRAVGMEYINNNANVGDLIDDALTMDVGLLAEQNAELGAQLVSAVDAIDAGVKALAELSADLTIAAGGDPQPAGGVAAARGYAAFDNPFRQWLAGLEPSVEPTKARAELDRIAVDTLEDLAHELIAAAGPSAWVGRQQGNRSYSTAQAELWFRRKIRKLFPNVRRQPVSTTESADQGAPA